MSPTTIDRLDYSKPPPGYRCWPIGGDGPNASEILFHDLSGWRDRGGSTTVPGKAAGWSNEADCLAAAWAHYKAHNDPPGFFVTGDEEADAGQGNAAWLLPEGLTSDSAVAYHDGFAATSAVRAAAWAWYDRRLAVHTRVADDPHHRIDFCGSCGAENEPQDDDECPKCGSTSCLISTWGEQQAERYRTGERYATHDPGIDDESPTWPRCLTWSDEQVTEVERWLVSTAAEIPEVLRG